jgi:hypothetical protein
LAEPPSPAIENAAPDGYFRASEVNDLFDPFSRKWDGWYTQGLRLETLSPVRRAARHFLPGIPLDFWCPLLCGPGGGKARFQSGWALGQDIYTPRDITNPAPQPEDHPWAGYLYLARTAESTYEDTVFNLPRRDRFTLELGMVGPWSLAGTVQRNWHRLWSFRTPKGWANQIHNEPTVLLLYQSALQYLNTGRTFSLVPYLRLALGTTLVDAEGGLTARYGWNIASYMTGRERSDGWFSYGSVFARAGVMAVLHDIVLDGNTFRDSASVDRRPIVYDLSAGVDFGLKGPLGITFEVTRRSARFDSGLPQNVRAQTIGTASLTWALC